MRWDRGHRSSDIEDRRGSSFQGFGGGGGLPLGGLVNILGMFGWKGMLVGLLLVAVLGGGTCLGGSGLSVCAGGGAPSTSQTSNRPVEQSAQEEELVVFVGYVF